MEKEYNLKDLKRDYEELQKKYNLPSFEKMNEDFGIEKASEVEVDLLIREIRRFISDKLTNYLRFIEAILNPVNVQMFVFSLIKSLENGEKEKLTEIYKILSKKEIELVELDLKFSEEKEAEFIIKSFDLWQNLKKDLLKIVENIKKNWDNKSEMNSKNYLG